MKKFQIIVALFIFGFHPDAQQVISQIPRSANSVSLTTLNLVDNDFSKNEQARKFVIPDVQFNYFEKSKNQKKIAWIFSGTGTALFAAGFIIPKGEVVDGGFKFQKVFSTSRSSI